MSFAFAFPESARSPESLWGPLSTQYRKDTGKQKNKLDKVFDFSNVTIILS